MGQRLKTSTVQWD